MKIAAGAPGNLFGGGERDAAREGARRILEAAESGDRAAGLKVAFIQGATRARGRFTDTLDALAVLLHDRARTRVARGDERGAESAARAIDAVERARERAAGNVSPNLVTAELMRALGERR